MSIKQIQNDKVFHLKIAECVTVYIETKIQFN